MELWLTSEDTGAYGRDIGVTLPELLWQLVEVIPEGAMLRIGMTNPPYILEHLEVCSLILTLHNFFSHLTLRRALIYLSGSSNNEACKESRLNTWMYTDPQGLWMSSWQTNESTQQWGSVAHSLTNGPKEFSAIQNKA